MFLPSVQELEAAIRKLAAPASVPAAPAASAGPAPALQLPQLPPCLPLPSTVASLASEPAAASLAAAALASRRSNPAIRGRLLALRPPVSKAAMATDLTTPPAAATPLVGVSSVQLPARCQPRSAATVILSAEDSPPPSLSGAVDKLGRKTPVGRRGPAGAFYGCACAPLGGGSGCCRS